MSKPIKISINGYNIVEGCPLEKVGIYDPAGLCKNPLTGKKYSDKYRELSILSKGKPWSKFPVYDLKNEITRSIINNKVTLVKAGTGSGKSVIVPYSLPIVFVVQE